MDSLFSTSPLTFVTSCLYGGSYFNRCEVILTVVLIVFPWWLMTLCTWCICWPSVYLLLWKKSLFSSFTHFWIEWWYWCFLLLSWVHSWYVLDTNHLSDISIVSCHKLPFTFINCFLSCKKLFSLSSPTTTKVLWFQVLH